MQAEINPAELCFFPILAAKLECLSHLKFYLQYCRIAELNKKRKYYAVTKKKSLLGLTPLVLFFFQKKLINTFLIRVFKLHKCLNLL